MRDIRPLIAPRSIAVIGASTNAAKSGGVLFNNLLSGGFSGPLYPVNPKAKEVLGRQAYARIEDVPERIDLVYVVLPSQFMEAALQQCVTAKVRAVCIITAGFAEAGPAGREAQARLKEIAGEAGILLAGPNTIGMVNTECKMMGSFVNFPRWEAGGISLFTQTGIFTGAVMRQIMDADIQRLPISKSIDVGNKIDVDEVDFLDFAKDDPGTEIIGLYIEDIRNRAGFLERARALRGRKPIVVLKPGRTAEGRAASTCHTGSQQSDNGDLDAALADAGILRVEDEDDFVNALKALSMLPAAEGRRVGIATTSGALGVIATDLVVQCGLKLAGFEPATVERMATILPDWLEPANPFDFWIGIDVKGPREAHSVALEAVFADSNVDMVLCTLLAPPNADFPEMGELLATLRQSYRKPVALVAYGSAGPRWAQDVEGQKIPVFATVRTGVRALMMMAKASPLCR